MPEHATSQAGAEAVGRKIACLIAFAIISGFASAASAQEATVCVQPNAAIPDNGPGIEAHIGVSLPANAVITDVRVGLDIVHPWIGDLVVTLSHDGEQATLVDQIALVDYPFACGGDDIDAVFSDAASITPRDLCAPNIAPNITGVVAPASSMSVFAGLDGAAPWVISIEDVTPFDTGVVREICVTLVYTVEDAACSIADVTTTGQTSGIADGIVDLSDFSYYLSLWANSEPSADITASGICIAGIPDGGVDLSDFSCYLSEWSRGCP